MRNLEELNLNGGGEHVPVTEEMFAATGFQLPETYKEFIRYSNAACHPELDSLLNVPYPASIGHLFIICDLVRHFWSYHQYLEWIKNVSDSTFPFAKDHGSNLWCFEFANNGTYHVALRFMDERFEKSLFMAESFEYLIDHLAVDPEDI